MHCTRSRQVASSVPDGIIGIFSLLNDSDHTVALGLNRPLTEMSTGILSWG